MSAEFLLTALIVCVAPGTGVLYTLAAGLSRGAWASIVAAFGCTLGTIPHLVAAVTGLAALLHTSVLAFVIFKYLGVAYLLYMAWKTLKERGSLVVEADAKNVPAREVIVNAILINLLNPKLSVFALAFLPQFVSPDATSPVWQMSGLAAVFMAMTFIVFIGYGIFASFVRRYVISRPAIMDWFRRIFAAAFAFLGLKLALSER
ncbi:MAG: LysE family translocator [Minwuia sp.]|uniref:LysE family translocator n=1 Tax=Minwuia sp. TaxID=2493630 RepID=UPI003A8BB900